MHHMGIILRHSKKHEFFIFLILRASRISSEMDNLIITISHTNSAVKKMYLNFGGNLSSFSLFLIEMLRD